MSFSNKVVLVTGASSGIGAAIAIFFSKEGANVAMVGRNETNLKNVAGKCAKKPLVIIADIAKDGEGKRIVEETVKTFGRLDVLVNNAGISKCGSILDGKILEAYDDTMSVNLRAVINITMWAAPHLIKTKGNIVNISSIASQTLPPVPNALTYYISKNGLDHFTKGAALELASSGIRVNAVSPGPVATDFLKKSGSSVTLDFAKAATPLKRVSQPEEITELVAYLAGEKAVGITGSIIVCDNGLFLKS